MLTHRWNTPAHPDIVLDRGSKSSSDGFLLPYWQSELRGASRSPSFLHTTPPRYPLPAPCSSRRPRLRRCSTATTSFSRQCTLLRTACPNSLRKSRRRLSKL